VPKAVYRSSCRDKHNCQRRDSNLDPLTPRSDALTTRLLRPAKSSTSFGWGKGGNVSSAGWQVTLCDPMWHMSSRSGVGTLQTAMNFPDWCGSVAEWLAC